MDMKKQIKLSLTTLMLLLVSLIFTPAFSQNGDPPPPPGEHGQTGNQVPGGGAAIGGGLAILIALGTGYGAKKWYDYRKRELADQFFFS